MSWKDSVNTVLERDPAARSFKEALWFSPGLHAILLQKVSHQQFMKGNFLLARAINYFGRFLTGADIHPGATIGKGFFIDHATGVVIGETAIIGRRVKLYQGVTLGALSFAKDEQGHLIKGVKRHPNVEDHVVIYAGATILGGETTIGHDSVIGANVWLIHSVPPHSKVYNQEPQPYIKPAGTNPASGKKVRTQRKK